MQTTEPFAPQIRDLSYAAAIREGLDLALTLSKDVFVLGQLVDYKSGIFGTTSGLAEKHGAERVQDFPVSEATMSSVALGASLAGKRPVIVHPRVDFMMYSVDSIVNWLSLWYFKSGEHSSTPVTIRAIIGKGWGQGPQHSKSLHSWFAHLPGLNVAMPATAFDAKGLLLESIFGQTPTLILESRSLFSMTAPVPSTAYRIRFGQAAVRKRGQDLTLVAAGYLVPLALRAAEELMSDGIDIEVIDPRTISPFDRKTVIDSVARTGRLLVADPGWNHCGFASEVITSVTEVIGTRLKANPARLTFPNSHTPMTLSLESQFYPTVETIKSQLRKVMNEK